jgi:hypothetical protein
LTLGLNYTGAPHLLVLTHDLDDLGFVLLDGRYEILPESFGRVDFQDVVLDDL